MKKILASSVLFALPMLALAQGSTGPALDNVGTLIGSIGRLVGLLLPIVVAIALLYFFWGLAGFILNSSGGDEKARQEGKNRMIWGIVTLFVMVSVWGLVSFVGSALGISQGGNSTNIPTIDGLPK